MTAADEYKNTGDDAKLASRSQDSADEANPDEQVLEIRQNIEETRAGMSETIDELQERLSPSYLKEQVKEQVFEQVRQVRDTVREATIGKVEDMVERVSDSGRTIGGTIRANPVPSALVGIGLAWLWMNRRSDSGGMSRRDRDSYSTDTGYDDMGPGYTSGSQGSRRGYGSGRTSSERYGSEWDRSGGSAGGIASRVGDAASGVTDQVQRTASNLAGKASNAVSGAVDQAQQTAGYLADRAQYQARRVEETFNQTLQENPLALGAVALALGTAVGLMVPTTRTENE
ncbi:MAG: DUF3618 domain-containing protein, partial [Pseudomonadota bacterium]|nr:DUF3618 domain-containing protein [Pseudomonadota bacterium]